MVKPVASNLEGLSKTLKLWGEWWQDRSALQKLCPLVLTLFYWFTLKYLGGLRGDHLLMGALLLALYYAGPFTHSFFYFMLPLFLMAVVYDGHGLFTDLFRGVIRVEEPYLIEKELFGIRTADGILIPAQWWQLHTHAALDFITGLAYISFIQVFVLTGLFFRFRLGRTGNACWNAEEIRDRAPAMMWGLFWLNIIACITYYLYPTAPPWYVDLYGFGPAQLDAPPNPAGGSRFDALMGVTLYSEFYSRTPNLFAAIPSTHVAYPLLAVFFAFKFKSLRIFCLTFYLLICFSAVYLNHHYILDILWGSAYALLIAWAVDRYYCWWYGQGHP